MSSLLESARIASADWFMPSDGEDLPSRPVPLVGPPIPAPYVPEVPQLSKAQLRALDKPNSPLHVEARRLKARIQAQLFLARHDFENRHGVKIVSETPKRPSPKE